MGVYIRRIHDLERWQREDRLRAILDDRALATKKIPI
jgi:hypothetical protein